MIHQSDIFLDIKEENYQQIPLCMDADTFLHNSNTIEHSPTLSCLKIIRFKVFNLAKSIFSLLLYIQQYTSGRSFDLG